ncbi:MAG: hypothetical protein JWR90_3671 [Marmoricola sp.]|jgi:hypothetical protein|nr:hypothetical protein [Marmoricola sp.]
MSSLGRFVFLVMIPLNVLLVVWAWIGRLFLGAPGWFMILMTVVVPFLLLALLLTTVLAFRGSDKPHSLTGAQTLFQLAVWAGLLGFGFFLVDFGDTDDSQRSVFTNLVGTNDGSLALSTSLAAVSTAVAVLGWLVLLVLLVAQRRRHRAGVAYA